MINADYYARDAKEAVEIAKGIFNRESQNWFCQYIVNSSVYKIIIVKKKPENIFFKIKIVNNI
jgi:hypothetical protein